MCFASDGNDAGQSGANKQERSIAISIGGQVITLEEPTLAGDESEKAQKKAIESVLGGVSFRQFSRDSVVAPVRIKLKYIYDGDGSRVGHLIHIAFVIYAGLDEFSADSFARRMMDHDESLDERSGSLDVFESELEERGIEIDPATRFQRVQFTLLDKVRLEGVLRIENEGSDSHSTVEIVLDDRFENFWSPLDDLTQKRNFSGFLAWISASELAPNLTDRPAVFVEARLALHEPSGWFSGSNFLRSKLPLAIQESVRSLRRKLD